MTNDSKSGRLDAVRRGDPGVEGLPYRAELRLEAGGARSDEVQRLPGLLSREADDARRGDRRAEGAGRRGRGGRVDLLGHRERSRQDRDWRMPDMGEMRVVVVERSVAEVSWRRRFSRFPVSRFCYKISALSILLT